MQKQKKKTKNAVLFQNLLHHISTIGALQNIIQPDSGSYSVWLQLLIPLEITNDSSRQAMKYQGYYPGQAMKQE